MKKTVSLLIVTLLISTFAIPVLANSGQYDRCLEEKLLTYADVRIGNCYTTDFVNGWEDTGLRIKEWPIDGEVYAYIEVYSEDLSDLQGVQITHRWMYDNGSGLVNVWDWNYVVPEPWTSCWSYTYWQIGLDFGKGWGYIEILANDVSIGKTNNYAMDNTAPNTPTITGDIKGASGEAHDYTFSATDPDGFDIFYVIDWGDGSEEVTIGPFESGESTIESHTYAEDGDYTIRCKTVDLVDAESEWATLEVSMPRIKAINLFLERLMERFPILEQILLSIYDKLTGFY